MGQAAGWANKGIDEQIVRKSIYLEDNMSSYKQLIRRWSGSEDRSGHPERSVRHSCGKSSEQKKQI